MLPIWYLTTSWQGKQWNFAMNGQTGKFTGDLPIDNTKLGLITGGSAIAVAVVMYLIMQTLLVPIIAALIVGLVVCFSLKGSMKPVHNATQANEYMEKNVHLVLSNDTYLRTERKQKQQNNSSSGG